MAQHNESLSYNDWNVETEDHSSHMEGSSSGLARKTSALLPIRHVIGTISATVTGGYGWVAAHDEEEEPEYDDDLKVDLTASLYLVASGGSRTLLRSATGSAGRGGFLDLWDHSTTATFSYNTSSLTEAQKQSYPYLQVEFTCVTSKDSLYCDRDTNYENHDDGNPSGTISWTIRDTINVAHRNSSAASYTAITDLYTDGTYINSLKYDGSTIF